VLTETCGHPFLEAMVRMLAQPACAQNSDLAAQSAPCGPWHGCSHD